MIGAPYILRFLSLRSFCILNFFSLHAPRVANILTKFKIQNILQPQRPKLSLSCYIARTLESGLRFRSKRKN
jgi:hypothetical protein